MAHEDHCRVGLDQILPIFDGIGIRPKADVIWCFCGGVYPYPPFGFPLPNGSWQFKTDIFMIGIENVMHGHFSVDGNYRSGNAMGII